MPTGPGWTTLAKPSPTPPTTAVPQSGPITSSPRSAAARLSATSCSTGTLSLKIITSWPALDGVHRLDEGVRTGHRDQRDGVGAGARSAAPVVRGGASSRRPARRGGWTSASARSTPASAVSSAPPSASRTATTMSLGVASAGTSKPISVEHLEVERGGHRDLRGRDAVDALDGSGSPAAASPSRRTRPSELHVPWSCRHLLQMGKSRGEHPPAGHGRTCARPGPAPLARGSSSSVPSEASQAANSGITSPCIAQSSSVADSRWSCGARARTAASTSGVATPAARCTASQPHSTSSPYGVSPSPRPTSSAASIGPGAARARQPRDRYVDQPPTTTGCPSRCSTPPRTEARATSGSRSSAVRSAQGTAVARVPTTPTQRPATSTYTASGPRCSTSTCPSGVPQQVLPHPGVRRRRITRPRYPPRHLPPGNRRSHHRAPEGCVMSSIGSHGSECASERNCHVDVQVGGRRSGSRSAGRTRPAAGLGQDSRPRSPARGSHVRRDLRVPARHGSRPATSRS